MKVLFRYTAKISTKELASIKDYFAKAGIELSLGLHPEDKNECRILNLKSERKDAIFLSHIIDSAMRYSDIPAANIVIGK